jgi:predicted ABC-type transport system involved in lysophospholipase L1 biosynthesis ATPase subunit
MTSTSGDVVFHLAGVVKHYNALRPLRLRDWRLPRGHAVAIHGFDKAAAEVLVNLLTGSTLPEEGEVRVFGRATSDIADSTDWLESLRRFALLSERTVLVEQLTVEQNLAIPHTLAVDPMPADVREAVRAVAEELGLSELLPAPVQGLGAFDLMRVRLGRVLALEPELLLAEHPTAGFDRADAVRFGQVVAGAVGRRRMAAVYLTADQEFAKVVGREVLALRPATGELSSSSGWRRWFGSGGSS